MMADGVFQASEATIVEKGWLQSGVTQRRGAKLIPILGQPSHLFQAEVFVGSGTIEGNIANSRRDLRHADHVLFEIAEHLIGLARHGMTLDTTRLAEEEQRTSLLIQGERIFMAACELIDRGVGEYQRKLEFSDGLAKHVEGDIRPLCNFRKYTAKEFAVNRRGVQTPQNLGANGVVITWKIKSSRFGTFCWRNEGLGDQQMREIGEGQVLGWGEQEPEGIIERIICQGGKT